MATDLNRRDFLRGRKRPPTPMRPPYAVAERAFTEMCDGCADCRKACPAGVILIGEDGLPRLDFADDACTFCGECAAACPTGALDAGDARPWIWTADIRANCLSYTGITCRACVDACDAGAIRFRLLTGGRDAPLLDSDACTGCGACLSVCPASAISFQQTTPSTMEMAQ